MKTSLLLQSFFLWRIENEAAWFDLCHATTFLIDRVQGDAHTDLASILQGAEELRNRQHLELHDWEG